jgi:hypothetical protein
MIHEIILTPYQATVFNAAEVLLRTQGYLGEALFEDTYVISKKLAQYIQNSIPQSNGTVSVNATMAYNYVTLGGVTGTVSTGGSAGAINSAAQESIQQSVQTPVFQSGAASAQSTPTQDTRQQSGGTSVSAPTFGMG